MKSLSEETVPASKRAHDDEPTVSGSVVKKPKSNPVEKEWAKRTCALFNGSKPNLAEICSDVIAKLEDTNDSCKEHASALCSVSHYGSEWIQWLERETTSGIDVYLLLQLTERLLLHCARLNDVVASEFGGRLARGLLDNGWSAVSRHLMPSVPSQHTRVALQTLTAVIVVGGVSAANQLFSLLKPGHPGVLECPRRVGISGKPTSPADVRAAFLLFLSAWLSTGSPELVSRHLVANPRTWFHTGIFGSLHLDPARHILAFLGALKDGIIDQPDISKTQKVKLFNNRVLAEISAVLDWSVSEEDSESVQAAAAEFLTYAGAHAPFNMGLRFADHAMGATIQCRNPVLLGLVEHLTIGNDKTSAPKSPHAHSVAATLLTHSPDMFPHWLSRLRTKKPQAEPFIDIVVAFFKDPEAVNQLMERCKRENVEENTLVRMILAQFGVPSVGKLFVDPILAQPATYRACVCLLNLLHTVVHRASICLSRAHHVPIAVTALKTVLASLPSPSQLLGLFKPHLQSQLLVSRLSELWSLIVEAYPTWLTTEGDSLLKLLQHASTATQAPENTTPVSPQLLRLALSPASGLELAALCRPSARQGITSILEMIVHQPKQATRLDLLLALCQRVPTLRSISSEELFLWDKHWINTSDKASKKAFVEILRNAVCNPYHNMSVDNAKIDHACEEMQREPKMTFANFAASVLSQTSSPSLQNGVILNGDGKTIARGDEKLNQISLSNGCKMKNRVKNSTSMRNKFQEASSDSEFSQPESATVSPLVNLALSVASSDTHHPLLSFFWDLLFALPANQKSMLLLRLRSLANGQTSPAWCTALVAEVANITSQSQINESNCSDLLRNAVSPLDWALLQLSGDQLTTPKSVDKMVKNVCKEFQKADLKDHWLIGRKIATFTAALISKDYVEKEEIVAKLLTRLAEHSHAASTALSILAPCVHTAPSVFLHHADLQELLAGALNPNSAPGQQNEQDDPSLSKMTSDSVTIFDQEKLGGIDNAAWLKSLLEKFWQVTTSGRGTKMACLSETLIQSLCGKVDMPTWHTLTKDGVDHVNSVLQQDDKEKQRKRRKSQVDTSSIESVSAVLAVLINSLVESVTKHISETDTSLIGSDTVGKKSTQSIRIRDLVQLARDLLALLEAVENTRGVASCMPLVDSVKRLSTLFPAMSVDAAPSVPPKTESPDEKEDVDMPEAIDSDDDDDQPAASDDNNDTNDVGNSEEAAIPASTSTSDALLGGYGATMSQSDQRILAQLRLHSFAGPVLWGPAAVQHMEGLKARQSSLRTRPSSHQILEQLDPAVMKRTVEMYSLQLKLDSGAVEPNDNIYDMRFLLPLLVRLLDESDCPIRPFLDLGCGSLLLSSLSSHDGDGIRPLAYLGLSRLKHLARTDAVPPVQYLLGILKNSIAKPNQRLCSLLTIFLAEALRLATSPSELMHKNVMSLLLRTRTLDLESGAPSWFAWFVSSTMASGTAEERSWLLTLARRGLRERSDVAALARLGFFQRLCASLIPSPDEIGLLVRAVTLAPRFFHSRTNIATWCCACASALTQPDGHMLRRNETAFVDQIVSGIVEILKLLWGSILAKETNKKQEKPKRRYISAAFSHCLYQATQAVTLCAVDRCSVNLQPSAVCLLAMATQNVTQITGSKPHLDTNVLDRIAKLATGKDAQDIVRTRLDILASTVWDLENNDGLKESVARMILFWRTLSGETKLFDERLQKLVAESDIAV